MPVCGRLVLRQVRWLAWLEERAVFPAWRRVRMGWLAGVRRELSAQVSVERMVPRAGVGRMARTGRVQRPAGLPGKWIAGWKQKRLAAQAALQ